MVGGEGVIGRAVEKESVYVDVCVNRQLDLLKDR